MTRRFIDAPVDQRCVWDVTMRDGSKAQCGRYKKVGDLCTQHAKMAASLSGEAWSAVTKRCFDTGGNFACAEVSATRCTVCPNKKAATSGVGVPLHQTFSQDTPTGGQEGS